MRHFPLRHDHFEHEFGIRALAPGETILERTATYEQELKLKRKLLEKDRPNYFQVLPESRAACAEAADWLMPWLDRLDPCNRTAVRESEAPAGKPLLDVALRLQEDLVVLSGDVAAGHPVLAGVVCFPSGWSISQKLGQSITDVHAPVPEYVSKLACATARLLAGLKAHRPVWRLNWGIRYSDQLDQSPKQLPRLRSQLDSLTSANVGERCSFRVERQTLSRLPATQAILFTIHTHQCPLNQLTESERGRLLKVILSCPEPTLQYKGIAPIKDLVVDHLIRIQQHPGEEEGVV